MNIITISREFGSGGRELGKRLADQLEYDYYDSEIISAVAKQNDMDSRYVEAVLSNHGWKNQPVTFRSTLGSVSYMQSTQIALLLDQKKVIEGIASRQGLYPCRAQCRCHSAAVSSVQHFCLRLAGSPAEPLPQACPRR